MALPATKVTLLPGPARIAPTNDAVRYTIRHLAHFRHFAAVRPDIDAAPAHEMSDEDGTLLLVELNDGTMHQAVHPLCAPDHVAGIVPLSLDAVAFAARVEALLVQQTPLARPGKLSQ